MTSPETLPIPRITPARASAPRTGPAGAPAPIAAAHEHAWITESRHPTSEGTVVYVRCGACGIRRVDVQPSPTTPPRALSAELGGR